VSIETDKTYQRFNGVVDQSFRDRAPSKPDLLISKGRNAVELNSPDRAALELYPSAALPAKTIGFHVAEYEPGEASGTHRHMCEAILYIIQGSGYTMIEDTRVDWEAGDAIYVPPMCWHSQHAGNEPVKLIGMWNAPLLEALGIYVNEEAGDTAVEGAGHSIRDTLLP
jgi:gentisate 1,2-dioxygenase